MNKMMSEKNTFPRYGAVDPTEVVVVDSGFNATEFSMHCDLISSNLYVIQSSITNLSNVLQQLSSNVYTIALRDRIEEIQHQTNPVVNSTTEHVKQLMLMYRYGQKHHRLQTEKLKNKFQETTQQYSNVQRQVAAKIRMSVMHSTSQGEDGYEDNDQTHMLEEEELLAERRMQQKQLDREIETEHSLLLEREQRIRHIESEIINVNEIFRDLANMVQEQSETVDTLENHVEDTSSHVAQGTQQLTQALNYQKKYRRKLCCIFMMLLIVALIIVIIVVVETQK